MPDRPVTLGSLLLATIGGAAETIRDIAVVVSGLIIYHEWYR